MPGRVSFSTARERLQDDPAPAPWQGSPKAEPGSQDHVGPGPALAPAPAPAEPVSGGCGCGSCRCGCACAEPGALCSGGGANSKGAADGSAGPGGLGAWLPRAVGRGGGGGRGARGAGRGGGGGRRAGGRRRRRGPRPGPAALGRLLGLAALRVCGGLRPGAGPSRGGMPVAWGTEMPGLELWREETSSERRLQVIYPQHSKLTDKEKTNICYLSFPDSNSGCLGDTQFCFRFRQSSGRRVSLHCLLDHYDKDLPVYLKKDPAYFYGYVYFRQVRDKSLKRGYFQKSLVLISKLPYIHFFHTVLKQIAPEYFEKSEPYLEAACNDVDRWPAPVPGKTLHLPIMGVVMKVRIPTCHDKPGTTQIAQLTQQADTHISVILPTVHEVDLFRCFCPVFLHSQMLWELVLLGEPLVVMAPSPSESSETVLALVNCISPLKYFSDFRPYFTIHDSEFKEYTTRTQAPPSVILGVTNPFFAKTLQHWPHIIRIGDLKPAGEIPKQVKVKKLKNLKTLDSKPGVYTSYKPYLNRDEEIIKQLQKGVQQKRPSEAQSVILRRYFLELTQSFIIPLERYVASLMPLQKSISPWKSPPQLRQFLPEEFMKTLEKTGPQLTSRIKGDWIGLYRHFLKSPNFDGWFKTRRKEMTQKLEALHLEALCEEDLLLWTQKHTEVETVDLVLKLKNKLLQADRERLPVKPDTMEKLRTHIDAIILALPEDLQGILLKTGMT